MKKQRQADELRGSTQHIAVRKEGERNLTLRQNERSQSEGK